MVLVLVLVRLLNLVGLLSIAGCGLCVEPIEIVPSSLSLYRYRYRYRYCYRYRYHGALYNANGAEVKRRLVSS